MRGQVQGVGFRPFVWQLAQRFAITGEVLNDAEGVLIHAAGRDLDAFEHALSTEAPALSSIDLIESEETVLPARTDFVIAPSGASGAETRVTPDAATCADCRAEISDKNARRFGYAFTNCTNCGPRFTILKALPYDRAHTTMAPFRMCPDCHAEYENPADRRFHAQPIACPTCGPELFFEVDGQVANGDPISMAVAHLRAGKIIAVKGLGGFHLCCDALDAKALAELRHRKQRPFKPFALMDRLDQIGGYAQLSPPESVLLKSPAAPIVLLESMEELPDAIAPGMSKLGVMLPYTPLHHLLLDAWQPGGPLVMTSANLSGEPQVIGNAEARQKLSAVADGFLMHNRDIARRLDDGVDTLGPTGPVVLRRARGRTPGTLSIPETLPDRQVSAYGGLLKSAICLSKNGQALLSHHLGDLDNALTVDEFFKADQDLSELFDHTPDAIAVDLHPEFRATQFGRARAAALNVPVFAVQHHHAHMAAALGEHGWCGRTAVGLVLDGLGLGDDGTIWGGEILVGGYNAVRRTGYLQPAPLVGGDKAQSEPWRNAVMRLDAAGLSGLADQLFSNQPLDLLRQAARAGVNAPLSSSAGRLFDAVAACLGLAPDRQSYEGEAAMRLEALASGEPAGAGYAFDLRDAVLDPRPVFQALANDLGRGVCPAKIARRFHDGLAGAFAEFALSVATAEDADALALSGGCFQNMTLLRAVMDRLDGIELFGPGQVPANDGGLAFGQTLVALARMEAS